MTASNDSKRAPKRYRIGEFARHMGVTPDFLKHYEALGLINAQHRESGYRYFSFSESPKLLECLRLKAFGLPLKSIATLVYDAPAQELMAALDERADAIEREAAKLLAVAAEQRRRRAWFEARKLKPCDWTIDYVPERLFLPHSHEDDFVEDAGVMAALPAWTEAMPIVKSALNLDMDRGVARWGLAASVEEVRALALPITESVETLPAAKAFIYEFSGAGEPGGFEALLARRHDAFERAAALNLPLTGRVTVEVFMTTERERARAGYGRIVMPLKV